MATLGSDPSTPDGTELPDGLASNLLEGASYEEMLDALPDPVFLCTPDGDVLYWNHRAREVAGYSDDELAVTNITEVVPEELRPRLREKIAEVVETGSARLDVPVVTGAGKKVPFEVTGSLIEREGKELICGIARDITERKVHEENLRRREEQFRLLVEDVEEYAIFMLDRDGHITTWNEGAEKIKGYTEDEILGSHFSIFYPEEDVEVGKPDEALETAEREGQWVDQGWRRRKDGSLFWARVTVTAVYDEGGRLRGFTKVTRDMTERRRKEEELRQSEQRYRRLFEESQEGIAITTPEGEIVDANPAALRMLGYSVEDLEELEVGDLYVDPSDRERGRQIIAEEGVVRELDVRLRRKDGEEIICQISSTPRRGPEGEIQVFQTFFRDVTEQKQTRQALRESERRHRRLFEESRDAIVLTTPEGDILDVNSAAEDLFGYSQEDLLRLEADELYAEPEERRYRIVPTLLESDSSRVLEAWMRREDGSTFLASASVTVHRTEAGTPELIQALVRDVTDYRQLQRDVLRAQEEERRRLGQDLHDGVASQLSGISIMLSTATQELDEDHPALPRIEKAKGLLKESSEDVRRLSRGLSPVRLSEAGLSAALDRLAENTESCRFVQEGDLAVLSEEQETHLYWIAQEAVTNARKYAEADEIVIQLSTTQEEGVLVVRDNGEGFNPSALDEGGLGLRTMRYRAELIGGSFTLDSTPGEGTYIECRLRSNVH